MAKAATRDEIVALEKEYWEAMKRKDGKRASQLSGKRALTTSARGSQSYLDQTVAALKRS